jgi:hypothetical protein
MTGPRSLSASLLAPRERKSLTESKRKSACLVIGRRCFSLVMVLGSNPLVRLPDVCLLVGACKSVCDKASVA